MQDAMKVTAKQRSLSFTRFYAWFVTFMLSPLIAAAILIGNTIGAVVGLLYWYGDQLTANPWYLWPFIPNSPLSTFFVVPALALILWRRPGWPFLNAFAAFGVIKHGLWTVAFWVLYWLVGGPVTFEGLAMTGTHLIMAAQGLLLLGFTRLSIPVTVGLGLWFGFNDWLDYGPIRIHPGVPPGVGVDTMMWVAVALTVVLTVAYLWLSRRGGRLPADVINPGESESI